MRNFFPTEDDQVFQVVESPSLESPSLESTEDSAHVLSKTP